MSRSHAIDIHVGARLRQRRTLLGLTQTHLGNALGISFQQIHKYECGLNRMGSSRLFELAQLLDVPVKHFFKGIAPGTMSGKRKSGRPRAHDFAPDVATVNRETLKLVQAYYKIGNEEVRTNIRLVAKALAAKSY